MQIKSGACEPHKRKQRKTKCVQKYVGQELNQKTNLKNRKKMQRDDQTNEIHRKREVPDMPRDEISFKQLHTPRALGELYQGNPEGVPTRDQARAEALNQYG